MTLRKGMEDFLVAVPARVPRTEAVQFMRRYGVAGRAISHYRVYGRGYDAVRKFLDCIGMVEGSDYVVKTSEYDPRTKQIHWTGRGAIDALASDLVAAGPRFLDTLAGLVAAEKTAEEIVGSGVTRVLRVGSYTSAFDAKYSIGVDVTDVTTGLLSGLRQHFDEIGCDGLAIKDGVSSICIYEACRFPSVLPPHILELVLQVRKEEFSALLEKYSLPSTGLFSHTDELHINSLFRFLRKGELVPGVNILMSTCVADLMAGDPDTNPLIGYFATKSSVPHGDEKSSAMVFARFDSLICSSDSLAWIADDYPRFFEYVRDLYRMAYGDGLRYTFAPGCRIAVANGHAGVLEDACVDVITRASAEGISPMGTNAVAMLGMFVSKTPVPDPLAEFKKEPSSPVTVVSSLPEGCFGRLYGNTHVDVDDLPLEWFAMTHGIKFGGVYDSEGVRMDNVVRMRKFLDSIRTIETHSSFVKDNTCMVTEPGGDYSVASAFYAAVIAAIRNRVDSVKRSEKSSRPKGACHAVGPVVTGVYSGITTDKSLVMGQESENFTVLGSALPDHIKDGPYDANAKKAFTKAIEAMTSTKIQIRMDKRTEGVPRRHWIVIETNVDGPAFFREASDLDNFRTDIANAFLRTFVARNADPLCSVDEDARRTAFGHESKDYVISCATCGEYGAFAEVAPVKMKFGSVFGQTPVPDINVTATGLENWETNTGVDVRFALDTADRLYVIVTAEGPNVQWARLAYRAFGGLPVRSATALRKAFPEGTGVDELDSRTVLVSRGKEGTVSAVVSVWRKIVANSAYASKTGTAITAKTLPSFGPVVTFDRSHCPDGFDRPIRRETYRDGLSIGIP